MSISPSSKFRPDISRTDAWTLLRLGDNPNVPDFYPLHAGIEGGAAAHTLEYLRYGANPRLQRPPNMDTPMHILIGSLGVSMLKPLIDAGAEINDRDIEGATPLIRAVKNGDIGLVQGLLVYHPDTNAVDVLGNTALTYAIRMGSADLIRLLISSGAKAEKSKVEGPLATLQHETRTKIEALLFEKAP